MRAFGRFSTRRAGRAILVGVGLVVSACGGPAVAPTGSAETVPTPSAGPATTPSPAVAPTPEPAGAAWSWVVNLPSAGDAPVLTGDDGTVYVTDRADTCDLRVHAYDQAGREQARWPVCAVATGSGTLTLASAGMLYVSANGRLSGIDPSGAVSPGWPREGWNTVAVKLGAAVVQASQVPPRTLLAYDPTGADLPGWPVTVAGGIIDPVLTTPDGSLAILYLEASTGHRSVTVIDPDGSTRPGWPVRLPKTMDGRSAVMDLVTADGRIVVRSNEPWPAEPTIASMMRLQARVLAIMPNGSIPEGWPVPLDQPLSQVVAGPGNRLVAIAGNVLYGETIGAAPAGPFSVVALEPDGRAASGWPVRLPADAVPEAEASGAGILQPWALPPVVGDDGLVVVTLGGYGPADPDSLVLIDGDGTIATRYELPATQRLSHGVPATPSGPAILPVVIGGRALVAITLRTASATGELPGPTDVDAPFALASTHADLAATTVGWQDALMAVDRNGAVAGWPLLLPGDGFISQVILPGNGSVVVSGSADGGRVVAAVDPLRTGGSE